MTVLGIAGPGDPLANPAKTFKTFELVAKQAPDIKLCLVDQRPGAAAITSIPSRNTRSTTSPSPSTWSIRRSARRFIRGSSTSTSATKASKPRSILSEHQLRGLEMLTERGVLCKVNSVMIPGVNDHAPCRGEPGGEVARRLPAQHHAADLRAGAWHGIRPHRPARPDGARAEGAAGRLRRRR